MVMVGSTWVILITVTGLMAQAAHSGLGMDNMPYFQRWLVTTAITIMIGRGIEVTPITMMLVGITTLQGHSEPV